MFYIVITMIYRNLRKQIQSPHCESCHQGARSISMLSTETSEKKKTALATAGIAKSFAVKPTLEEYDDVRKYLNDYFEWRRSQDSHFSYASFADECGFASRSFLRLLLIGQRKMTDTTIHKFTKGLKLKAQDQDYFLNLTKFSQAESIDEREFYAQKIYRASKIKPRAVGNSYLFLSNKHIPRLLTLLTIPGIQTTSLELARILDVTESAIQQMLEILEGLKLAVKESSEDNKLATWTATLRNFSVEDSAGDLAIQTYHRKNMDDVLAAIELPPEKRDLRSALVPLSSSAFQSLQKELGDYLVQLLNKYQTNDSLEKQKLYLVNMISIPIGNEFGGTK